MSKNSASFYEFRTAPAAGDPYLPSALGNPQLLLAGRTLKNPVLFVKNLSFIGIASGTATTLTFQLGKTFPEEKRYFLFYSQIRAVFFTPPWEVPGKDPEISISPDKQGYHRHNRYGNKYIYQGKYQSKIDKKLAECVYPVSSLHKSVQFFTHIPTS